ncbi:terpenoid synthase [Armillaria gallica]|uniref:Terpenoid synthase n=1 Tax=Armillaria gallica TaxID=47427 RepID=A0A2H3D7E5_ARMGA|nr:terpenoid synthase [Armillaria gallica]
MEGYQAGVAWLHYGRWMPKDAIDWYKRNLNYNVPGGKLNRGMSVVDTTEIIKGTPLTYDEYLNAAVPAEMGQLIDLITAPEDELDLSKFSLKKHSLIVINKTARYSFYLPVALAMYISHYFQIQDDFLDFSGTPEQIGKIGTDILDNKCSWCVDTALAVCTPEQRKVLDENYGRKYSECERRVKEAFESLEVDLRKQYGVYEEKVYGELVAMIGEIPEVDVKGKSTLKREVFESFIDKIYKRTK